MKFDPMPKDEMLQLGLLPKGTYPFVIKAASEKNSKSGDPQIEVLLTVYDVRGREHLLYDYLTPKFESKLRHFCYAIGLGQMSEEGHFDTSIINGKGGHCKVYIREDKTGQYPPKNSIGDYIIDHDEGTSNRKDSHASDNNFINDPIPF
jgi:hypothetical protein